MSNHIKTIVKPNLKSDKDTNCRECQASCQSACKTSCTVGNQVCNK
ncbi:MAG: six-cysteine peptide SCIFF [Syntrophomonadaceae bacterium]|nr:six-cysteine peptide SCIFF [Syntrophomonadaceae bacterium]